MRIPARFHRMVYAVVMSVSMSLIVSAVLTWLHLPTGVAFVPQWLAAFVTACPVVFVSILVVSPWVERVVALLVQPGSPSR
ncbi:DUF2798 domain-containing protein [Pseudomethylobacillus aquaticus]|uniref:DUF2798 domain-containing protein n=1 Tax=Pseudomethylobacillus aquaticus TaxID=2676064 RepID=A0A3N0V2L6_9PROT|nr:DUF2798 domain-containing protein [Pseudomethylobacillus aquaticus]ROH87019.1 DUF2798 domain-containing protein [Pseudomethylobacillus aquaticus]